MQNTEINSRSKKKYLYDDNFFDSSAEIAFYIWLKDNDIEFTFHPNNMKFSYNFNGKQHTYCPDFLIGNFLYEIKGDHFFEDKDSNKKMINPFDRSKDGLFEAKHKCMIDNNVIILTAKTYEFFISYVNKKYGKSFLKSLKYNIK